EPAAAPHARKGSRRCRAIPGYRAAGDRAGAVRRLRPASARPAARRDVSRPRTGGGGMRRHTLSARVWHWVNAASLVVLFMSGLNISNAHRYLYWGEWGFAPEQAWLHVWRFPGWATIPGYYSLASARDWHVLFAWVFGLSLLLFVLAALLNGHFRRGTV